MSQLKRLPWQLHVVADPDTKGKLKIVTNTFVLSDLTEDDLNMSVSPFIGVTGQVEVHVHDSVGPEDYRKHIWLKLSDLFNLQRRATAFLTPSHPALKMYWYNISSRRLKYDVRGLIDAAKGLPVLFCGAGPSLEKQLPQIKYIVENNLAFVVTGGTGMKLLCDSGIKPHLALALDPFPQEAERFSGLSAEWQAHVPLLASASLYYECYRGWKGRLIAAEGLSCAELGSFIEGEGLLHISEGTVGVLTWLVNLMPTLGSDTLMLSGVDLCFGDQGETYAKNLDLTCSLYSAVRSDCGRKTKSNWLQEARYIGDAAAQHGFKVYNFSKGLAIPNSERASIYDETLFTRVAVPKIRFQKWTKAKYKFIQTQLDLFENELQQLRSSLHEEDLSSFPAYKLFLKQYMDVQEYQYWRSGIFNYSLLREILDVNASYIRQISYFKQPFSALEDFGPCGSPPLPRERQTTRTGATA